MFYANLKCAIFCKNSSKCQLWMIHHESNGEVNSCIKYLLCNFHSYERLSGTLSLILNPSNWHWALIWIQEGNVKDVWCLNDCQLLLNDDTGICRLSTSHTWHHLLAANVFLSSSGPGPSHQGVLQGPHFRPHFSQPTSQSLKVKSHSKLIWVWH